MIDLALIERKSKPLRMVAMLSTTWVQYSDFLAVGCGLNDCYRRTRPQRSGTQCNGTRTRWLFELRRH